MFMTSELRICVTRIRFVVHVVLAVIFFSHTEQLLTENSNHKLFCRPEMNRFCLSVCLSVSNVLSVIQLFYLFIILSIVCSIIYRLFFCSIYLLFYCSTYHSIFCSICHSVALYHSIVLSVYLSFCHLFYHPFFVLTFCLLFCLSYWLVKIYLLI